MPNVERFLEAQNASSDTPNVTVYQQAELELADGYKRTHWIWFVFPNLVSLGRSDKAIYYGIADENEAAEYMANDTLRSRYLHMVTLVMSHREYGRKLEEILGEVDAMKFRSSLELFAKYL